MSFTLPILSPQLLRPSPAQTSTRLWGNRRGLEGQAWGELLLQTSTSNISSTTWGRGLLIGTIVIFLGSILGSNHLSPHHHPP